MVRRWPLRASFCVPKERLLETHHTYHTLARKPGITDVLFFDCPPGNQVPTPLPSGAGDGGMMGVPLVNLGFAWDFSGRGLSVVHSAPVTSNDRANDALPDRNDNCRMDENTRP